MNIIAIALLSSVLLVNHIGLAPGAQREGECNGAPTHKSMMKKWEESKQYNIHLFSPDSEKFRDELLRVMPYGKPLKAKSIGIFVPKRGSMSLALFYDETGCFEVSATIRKDILMMVLKNSGYKFDRGA